MRFVARGCPWLLLSAAGKRGLEAVEQTLEASLEPTLGADHADHEVEVARGVEALEQLRDVRTVPGLELRLVEGENLLVELPVAGFLRGLQIEGLRESTAPPPGGS